MKIDRFEDLEAWKNARLLTKRVYAMVRESGANRDYRFRDQITAASVSVMNNIAEGFDSQSNNEFIRFLVYSRRSCSEVHNCLYVALDQEYITSTEYDALSALTCQTRKLIDGFLRYLRSYRRQAPKPT
jgi:four helix bundle protein